MFSIQFCDFFLQIIYNPNAALAWYPNLLHIGAKSSIKKFTASTGYLD